MRWGGVRVTLTVIACETVRLYLSDPVSGPVSVDCADCGDRQTQTPESRGSRHTGPSSLRLPSESVHGARWITVVGASLCSLGLALRVQCRRGVPRSGVALVASQPLAMAPSWHRCGAIHGMGHRPPVQPAAAR